MCRSRRNHFSDTPNPRRFTKNRIVRHLAGEEAVARTVEDHAKPY